MPGMHTIRIWCPKNEIEDPLGFIKLSPSGSQCKSLCRLGLIFLICHINRYINPKNAVDLRFRWHSAIKTLTMQNLGFYTTYFF
jgi:hypothetical protein